MTDIGLIREDKEREETLENNKLITTRGRNQEQSISTPTPRVYITNP